MRIKVLRALEADESRVASDLLQEKPRYGQAARCNECAGCQIFKSEKACQKCPGCIKKDGCNEYTRLCFTWDRSARNFFTGSIITGISSQFDLASSDLGKYGELVEAIRTAAIALDLALDDLPWGHPHKSNPRYSRERLDKDIENEESQLSRLGEVLKEHGELQDHLKDVSDELFDLEFEQEPTETVVQVPSDVLLNPTVTATTRELQAALGANFNHVTWEAPRTADKEVVTVEDVREPGDPEPGQPRLHLQIKPALDQVGNGLEDKASDHTVPRPRSMSELPNRSGTNLVVTRSDRDLLFNLSTTSLTRKDDLASQLIGIEEVMFDNPEAASEAVSCLELQLEEIQDKLKDLERMEQEIWRLVATVHGPETRERRAVEWRNWTRQVTSKVGVVRKECLRRQLKVYPSPPVLTPAVPSSCASRGSGHLERVRLPQFSGRSEDYQEFKMQFRELCGGEEISGHHRADSITAKSA